MHLGTDLEAGRVVRRVSRFTVEVEVEDALTTAHLSNTGRLQELLRPGTPALLKVMAGDHRTTRYDLLLVNVAGTWVSADAGLANMVAREALLAGKIPALSQFPEIKPEARLEAARVDFLLTGEAGRCLLEVKSVTLVEDGIALFPDAKTARGLRHLRLLIDACARGDAACVLFVVQREDATALRTNDAIDPEFARLLREAVAAGVLVLAYRCKVSPCEIELTIPIPVLL